jgi:uncharacterized membrane protein YhhN
LPPLRVLPLALALGAGAILLSILIAHGLGELLIPVVVYASVISAMLWRALARLGSKCRNARRCWRPQARCRLWFPTC